MLTVITRDPEETARLGKLLAELLEPGDFIALVGDLGSGKTHFVKGIAAGLGADPTVPVTSPTFTILNEYPGRLLLHHFDLYRLSGLDDVIDLGFEEIFQGDGVSAVEWPERLEEGLPAERLDVLLERRGEESREITFIPHGDGFTRRVAQAAAFIKKCFD